ncbi:MAG: hypothetical protein R2912_11540 [Eubacteriales bacterium]
MRARRSRRYAHLIAMANTNPVIDPRAGRASRSKTGRLRLCNLTQAAAAGEALGDEAPTDRAALSRGSTSSPTTARRSSRTTSCASSS